MEILQFIFSSFWVWLGATTAVLGATAIMIGGIVELMKACKPETRRVETYRDEDRIKVALAPLEDMADYLRLYERVDTHEAVMWALKARIKKVKEETKR